MTDGAEVPLKAAGKARAKGNLDVLRPGDPGHGAKASSEQGKPKGLRVEVEKGFQLDEDADDVDMLRVIDTDPNNKNNEIVLLAVPEKLAQRVYDTLGKHLGQSKKSSK